MSKEKKLENKENFSSLLENLDQTIYGAGCIAVDLFHFLKTAKDIMLFCEIWERAVAQATKKYDWPKEMQKHVLSLGTIVKCLG